MKKIQKKFNNIIYIITVIVVIICIIIAFLFLKPKQDIYKFDFFDGGIPGNTFKGEINFTNGNVDFTIIHGCSLINRNECPEDTIVKGALNKNQLELVKTAFEKNNRKDNKWLLTGVSYLIKGEKICDNETNITCEESGKMLIDFSNQN